MTNPLVLCFGLEFLGFEESSYSQLPRNPHKKSSLSASKPYLTV